MEMVSLESPSCCSAGRRLRTRPAVGGGTRPRTLRGKDCRKRLEGNTVWSRICLWGQGRSGVRPRVCFGSGEGCGQGRRGSFVHFPALSGREQLEVKKDFLCCVQSALPPLALSHASAHRPDSPWGCGQKQVMSLQPPGPPPLSSGGRRLRGRGHARDPPHPACGGDTQPASERCVS